MYAIWDMQKVMAMSENLGRMARRRANCHLHLQFSYRQAEELSRACPPMLASNKLTRAMARAADDGSERNLTTRRRETIPDDLVVTVTWTRRQATEIWVGAVDEVQCAAGVAACEKIVMALDTLDRLQHKRWAEKRDE